MRTLKIMSDRITKFVQHEYRNTEFEEMIQQISLLSGIPMADTRKIARNALEKWQRSTKRDILSLFVDRPDKRQRQIFTMCDILKTDLQPLIQIPQVLNDSVNIAEQFIERMFYIY